MRKTLLLLLVCCVTILPCRSQDEQEVYEIEELDEENDGQEIIVYDEVNEEWIVDQVEEVENYQVDRSRDSIIFSSNPDEEYLKKSLVPKQQPDSLWQSIIGDQNYTEADPEEVQLKDFDAPDTAPPFSKDLWQILLITIIAGVFIALLVKLVQVKPTINQKVGGLGLEVLDDAERNIRETDLERLLRLALEAKDYRSALRVRYLMVLKKLDEQGWIHHRQDKTNIAYVFELSGRKEQASFKRLTTIFEYVWYGNIDIPAEDDSLFEAEFGAYLNEIEAGGE